MLSSIRSEPEIALLTAHKNHPHEDQLTRFMCGDLPRHEFALIVRHLLTGCKQCVQATRALWELGERAPR